MIIKKPFLIPLVFAVIGFTFYSNAIYGPFIFDDEMYIIYNDQIQNISNLLKDFSGTRYIGYLSFAINYYFGGLNTFGYHLVNIIIHIINAILVYILIEAMGYRQEAIGKPAHSPVTIAFVVSLIFLVHPIQTQAVSYITQRLASLATFFYLLSLVLYVKTRETGNGQGAIGNSNPSPIAHSPVPIAYYILSILSAILAMKTKEISFTLPFIILLYEFTFFRNTGLKTLSRFFYLLPFFLTLPIIPLTLIWPKGVNTLTAGIDAGEMIREQQLIDIGNISAYNYFITQFRVIVTYIRLMVFPVNQTFDYDYPLSLSIFESATFISFIFLLIIFSSAVYLYFRSRRTHHAHGLLISFGILWFFVTLSVESSVIPIKDVIFEHRLYLPSVGFILSATGALFYGFDYLEKETGKSFYNYLLSVLAVVSVILALSAYKRNILWGDNYLMWLDNFDKSPNKAEVNNNVGIGYAHKGFIDKAMEHYLIAIRLKPGFAEAYHNLGIAYYKKGLVDEAIKYHQIVLKLMPNFPKAHYDMGAAYYYKGLPDIAMEHYETAVRLKPNFSEAYNNMGLIYYDKGFFDKAIEHYEIAMRLKPDFPGVYSNLGNAYYKEGLLDKAVEYYRIALKLAPGFSPAHSNLGVAYMERGQLDEAIQEYMSALRLVNHVDTHYNLGTAYKKKGLNREARREFEAALQLKPNDKEIQQAIKSLARE